MVRCWEPHDAPLLADAVESSLAELRPWMPWAEHEPRPIEDRVELLRRFRGDFDLDQDYVYGIFDPQESSVVGGTGLHRRRGPDALEIGYWIRTSRVGEGLATEASAVLTRVAFEVCGVDRVEIRTDPRNERSKAIPRRLGFVEEATLRRRLAYPGAERRDVVLYSIFRDAFPGSPAEAADLEAFDARGARVA